MMIRAIVRDAKVASCCVPVKSKRRETTIVKNEMHQSLQNKVLPAVFSYF